MSRPTVAAVAWDAWRVARGRPSEVAVRQRRRLDALVKVARRRSRFYAARYRGLPDGPLPLHRLPAVTKPELMARFDDWVTDRAVTRAGVEAFVADLGNVGAEFLGRYTVFTTSGSTGMPALLVQDRRAIAVMTGLAYVRSAGAVTPRMLARAVARRGRMAAVFATGGHFLSTAMFERRLRRAPVRRRFARYFSVLDPLPELVAGLNAYQPAGLGSYPSMLAVLAEEQLAGRLRIRPALVATGGEALTAAARRCIEEAFGCQVFETYSASEAAPLSQPCRRGRLHVNADWFLVEPVDADGTPVPPGTWSHSVLVTNLANHVQPVIRYDLGDSVVIDPGPCPCRSPLPTLRVAGRTDEILRVPRPDGTEVALPPMALSTVVEETPGVHRFQVLRTAATTLTIRLETASAEREAVWAALRDRLDGYLRTQGLPGVTLVLAPDPPRVNPGSGKLRHVVDVSGAGARTQG